MKSSVIILETKELSRYFGGLCAVDHVNLLVHSGSFHSIIGPNGAGKTTLLNLVSGTLKSTNGSIYFKGEDITDLPAYRMAAMGMGRSFQITNIFPTLTVFENVRLAAQALGNDNFRLLLDAKRLHQYQDRAEAVLAQVGLDRVAVSPAAALSHGDKRRLEIAMLLAQDPEVLMLDEPTAGLAAEQVPRFMQMLQEVIGETGKTVILVEHNMGVVMNLSDRISVMHQGRLLAEGTPQEITRNEEVQHAYLGTSLSLLDE